MITRPAAEPGAAYLAREESRLLAQARSPDGGLPPLLRAAVVGAGTMGSGIAVCLADAGLQTTLIDIDPAALERGMAMLERHYARQVERQALDGASAAQRLARVSASNQMASLDRADLVIESVFEDLATKQHVLAEVGRHVQADALLATNTSGLDIDTLAHAAGRPGQLIGLHFFSPAQVMRLVEVVIGESTSALATARATSLLRTMGKVAVPMRSCPGFVGNRMKWQRDAQLERLLLEGVRPSQLDHAMRAFGFAMGPLATRDMAGLDVGWRRRKSGGERAPIEDALCEAGRFGQKSGAGYYRYEAGSREPLNDPAVEALIAQTARTLGVAQRDIAEEDVVQRLLFPLINEGARILEERIVSAPGDIDLVWRHGFGWPARLGGPMYHAETVGLALVAERLREFAAQQNDARLEPAPLLDRAARESARWVD